ncbi:MAG TPA: hypothetical protein VGJ14_13150 [Sporichthyaceae bacterium]|jgi:hypothetical protein
MNELLALSFIAACIAGVVSYVVAYDRAWAAGSRHQARKLALRATPGPFVYYLVLGVLVSVIAPHFVHRR